MVIIMILKMNNTTINHLNNITINDTFNKDEYGNK